MQERKVQLKTNTCANFQENNSISRFRGYVGFDGITHKQEYSFSLIL
jgi:hypothetical protein